METILVNTIEVVTPLVYTNLDAVNYNESFL